MPCGQSVMFDESPPRPPKLYLTDPYTTSYHATMGRPRLFSDDEVVTAAMEVFWRKGYEAATTEDLCAATGLGRGSLYNAYGGKHQLYQRALDRYGATAAVHQLALLDEPGTATDRLRGFLLSVVDIDMADPDRRGCLALNAAIEPAGRDATVSEQVRRQFVRVEQALCHLIAVGQSTGEFRADQPPLRVARTMQSTYYGLRALARVTDDRDALVDVVEGAIAAL